MRSVDEGEQCPKCHCTVRVDSDGCYICGCYGCGCEDEDDEDFPDDNDEGP